MNHWEGWRGSSRHLGIAICLCAAACGGSSGKPDAGGTGDAGWQSHLAAALGAQPLYSIGFLDPGPFLATAFVDGAAGDSCAAFTSVQSGGGDLWILGVAVPSLQPDAYPVKEPIEPSPSDVSTGEALVYIEHRNQDAGLDLVAFAASGAVTIGAAPSLPGDEADGGHVTGSLTYVALPADPLAIGSCQDAGAGQPQLCTCDDLYGNPVSICDGGPLTCCRLQDGGGTVSINITVFNAAPCPALCVTAPGISNSECQSL